MLPFATPTFKCPCNGHGLRVLDRRMYRKFTCKSYLFSLSTCALRLIYGLPGPSLTPVSPSDTSDAFLPVASNALSAPSPPPACTASRELAHVGEWDEPGGRWPRRRRPGIVLNARDESYGLSASSPLSPPFANLRMLVNTTAPAG